MSKEMLKKALKRRKVTVLAVAVALTAGTASTAVAANGSNFILGVLTNTATAITRLTGNVAGPSLQIVNPNAGAAARALDLQVAAGKPPLTVNATAGKASNLNADKVDGLEGASFLQKTGKAADADKLDGKDSTEFIQGRGTAPNGEFAISPGQTRTFLSVTDPKLEARYECPNTLSNSGIVRVVNTGSENVNMFLENSTGGPLYLQAGPGVGPGISTDPFGEHATFQVQGTATAHIEVFSAHRETSGDCHVQAQALATR